METLLLSAMRSTHYFFLFFLLPAGFWCPAQTVPGIKHSYAFLTEHQPGNIMVKPDGTPVHDGPDTLLTVYLEMPGAGSPTIAWKNAWWHGVCYSINAVAAGKLPQEAGTAKAGRKKIILTAAKGNCWWKLDLFHAEGNTAPPLLSKPGALMLEGRQAGKKIILHIDYVVELATIPSV